MKTKVLLGLIAYFPLVAILLEVLWVFLMFLVLIFSVGDTPYENTPAKERAFSTLAAGPVALGTVVGILGIVMRCPKGLIGWICIVVGTCGCAALLYSCLQGWIR